MSLIIHNIGGLSRKSTEEFFGISLVTIYMYIISFFQFLQCVYHELVLCISNVHVNVGDEICLSNKRFVYASFPSGRLFINYMYSSFFDYMH